MADSTPPLPNQTFIQSKMPADNSYGRQSYTGAASDLPGERTHTDPKTGVAPPQVDAPYGNDHQTRAVDASPVAPHPGMTTDAGRPGIAEIGASAKVPAPRGGYRPSVMRIPTK